MKSAFFILSAYLAVFACSKGLLSSSAQGDVLGESFNFNGKAARGAIAYGLANTGGFSPESNPQFSNYIKPEFVVKLPNKIALPSPGPLESVEEVPSTTNYYDGSTKLNKITINCKLISTPSDCIHNSSCGWCGSTNTCISGTNLGPLEPCVKSSYIFSAPYPNWNPQTNVVNEQVAGMSLTVVNK